MSQLSKSSQYHAILVGVNAYKQRPLRGSVNDVTRIKSILEDQLNSCNITILTATEKRVGQGERSFVEDDASLPTWMNVYDALLKVKKSANPGDYVYFHYSGHGQTEAPNEDPDDKATNKFAGDLALCLLNDDDPWKVAGMNGQTLGGMFDRIVQKGIILTAVLDCCFAATVYRRETVRCLEPTEPQIRSAAAAAAASPTTYRSLSMTRNWLMDPKGYTVLAASGPLEPAHEVEEQGRYFGKLSYFLYDVLNQSDGLRLRHSRVYRHLRGKFFQDAQRNQSQIPCLFGNKKLAFFGPPREALAGLDAGEEAVEMPVINSAQGPLLLGGEAHGLSQGDEVVVMVAGGARRSLRILEARAFTSLLGASSTTRTAAESRWSGLGPTAVVQSRRRLQDFPVRLDTSLAGLDEWGVVLSSLALRAVPPNGDEMYRFQIRRVSDDSQINGIATFQILDRTGHELINMPPMPVDRTGIHDVAAFILHITKYTFVKELCNHSLSTDDPFMRSFSINARTYGRSNEYTPGQLIEIQEADGSAPFSVEISVENFGSTALYVYIYALSSIWEVEHIHYATLSFLLPSRQQKDGYDRSLRHCIYTEMPDVMFQRKPAYYEDTLKVIITSHWTAFDIFEQQSVGQIISQTSGNRNQFDNLEALERWAAFDFPIRTWVSQPDLQSL